MCVPLPDYGQVNQAQILRSLVQVDIRDLNLSLRILVDKNRKIFQLLFRFNDSEKFCDKDLVQWRIQDLNLMSSTIKIRIIVVLPRYLIIFFCGVCLVFIASFSLFIQLRVFPKQPLYVREGVEVRPVYILFFVDPTCVNSLGLLLLWWWWWLLFVHRVRSYEFK